MAQPEQNLFAFPHKRPHLLRRDPTAIFTSSVESRRRVRHSICLYLSPVRFIYVSARHPVVPRLLSDVRRPFEEYRETRDRSARVSGMKLQIFARQKRPEIKIVTRDSRASWGGSIPGDYIWIIDPRHSCASAGWSIRWKIKKCHSLTSCQYRWIQNCSTSSAF